MKIPSQIKIIENYKGKGGIRIKMRYEATERN